MANEQNLKPFTSEYQPKDRSKAGRKPSQLKGYLKENNLGSEDATLIAQNLLLKSQEELKELALDKKVPILLSGAAAALLKDMQKGRVDVQQWLYDRGFGKAIQEIKTKNEHTIMTPEERNKKLDELAKKYLSEMQGK